MKILKTLGTKPWLHEHEVGGVAAVHAGPDTAGASRIALRFFLAMVGVMFFLFIITRRQTHYNCVVRGLSRA